VRVDKMINQVDPEKRATRRKQIREEKEKCTQPAANHFYIYNIYVPSERSGQYHRANNWRSVPNYAPSWYATCVTFRWVFRSLELTPNTVLTKKHSSFFPFSYDCLLSPFSFSLFPFRSLSSFPYGSPLTSQTNIQGEERAKK